MGKRYVLVVDDEPGVLDSYRQYLLPKQAGAALDRLRKLQGATTGRVDNVIPAGWELVTATSGEEAIAFAQAALLDESEVCLALFDVKMAPGIDGITTMLAIVKIFPSVRCGVVSAFHDRSVDEINSLFDEAHRDRWDFISKPFTEAEIRQKVRMLASTWLHARAEEEMRRQLSELNANLEQLVAGRTNELKRAQAALAVSEARMRRELEAAGQLQLLLAPTKWPDGVGYDFAAHVEPSVETGGDLCGWMDVGGGEVGVFVCDVTGHGAAAALVTSMVYSSIRSLEAEFKTRWEASQTRAAPSEILVRLNTIVRESTRGTLFATFFMGILNAKLGRMRYANAGHEWPLIARRDGSASILPLLASHRIGAADDARFPDLETTLGHGDVLVLYSDGVTDAIGTDGRMYDRRRLFKALQEGPKSSADAMLTSLLAHFRAAIPPDVPLEDDVTYLVVRASD